VLALPARPALVSVRDGRRLTVHLLPGDPHALLLEEEVTSFRTDSLDRLGLTARESEVLRAATRDGRRGGNRLGAVPQPFTPSASGSLALKRSLACARPPRLWPGHAARARRRRAYGRDAPEPAGVVGACSTPPMDPVLARWRLYGVWEVARAD
jgi:hypothetical protein